MNQHCDTGSMMGLPSRALLECPLKRFHIDRQATVYKRLLVLEGGQTPFPIKFVVRPKLFH